MSRAEEGSKRATEPAFDHRADALATAGLLVLLRRTLPRRAAVSAQGLGDGTGLDTDVAAHPHPLQGARSPSSDIGISVVDGAGQPSGRRRFLALAVGAIGAAAVAVPGGRRLWAQHVAAARAAVAEERLPPAVRVHRRRGAG
ncbi:hypothetical protein [Streptomyces cahuitamycinicus]|uniref:hypothetical protein n=1 Tax=Streptomyces cahuitamycinicus TaxID=2070367 RepID=UPI0015E0D0D9|nr:hypothetical protein [Streptomyces cahuitamycinicus]